MRTRMINQVCLIVLCAITFTVSPQAVRADGRPLRAPLLQRMIIMDNMSYAVDYADPRGRGGRSLVMVEGNKPPVQQATTVFIFGRHFALDAVTGKFYPPGEEDPFTAAAYRWTIGGRSLFAAWRLGFGDDVQRYSMDAFVIEPDDARMFDSGIEGLTDIKGPTMHIVGGVHGNYTCLNPIRQKQTGLMGWKEGDEDVRPGLQMGTPPQMFNYDIRALDDVRIELYMTADGELARWLYDGKLSRWLNDVKSWKYQRKYDLRVSGEFLVCDEGRSIVAERDGRWSLIRNIENATPTVQAIVDRVEGEPLTVVEDKVEQKNFFLHRNALLDDNGREVFTARAVRDHTDRLRKVIDFVVSGRAPQP